MDGDDLARGLQRLGEVVLAAGRGVDALKSSLQVDPDLAVLAVGRANPSLPGVVRAGRAAPPLRQLDALMRKRLRPT